jgi:hypothetical protein
VRAQKLDKFAVAVGAHPVDVRGGLVAVLEDAYDSF